MKEQLLLAQLFRYAAVGLIGLTLITPLRARAALIIRAVDAGTPTADDEFIQFENTGPAAVDLSHYSVQIKNNGAATVQKKNFTAGMTIAPAEQFIVAHKEGRYASQARMTYSSLALSAERGGTVALVATATLLDTFTVPPAVATFQFSPATSTPPAQTAHPPPRAVSTTQELFTIIDTKKKIWPIELSEMMPRPLASDEFIEIKNLSPDAVDVAGLVIRDAAGVNFALGSRNENTLLGAGEHRAWWRARTRIALNDTDGELVQLLDPAGDIVDQISIAGDAVLGASYARVAGGWHWTMLPTPSQPNQFIAHAEPPVARAIIPSDPHRVSETIFFSAEDTTDPNGDITKLLWNFGDGLTADTATTTHRFQSAGTYRVTFSAIDATAASSTVWRDIMIIDPKKEITAPTVSPPTTTNTLLIASSYAPPTHAPTRRVTTRAPQPTVRSYKGIVTVPPGIRGVRRFQVGETTVEITTTRPELARLARGSVVSYTGRDISTDDASLHRISKTDRLQLVGYDEPPPLTEITGDIIELRGTLFIVATTSADVTVLARARTATNKRLREGDRVTVRGVLTRESSGEQSLVLLSPRDILLHTQPHAQPEKFSSRNMALLGGSGLLLLLMHILFTRYAQRIYHATDSGTWRQKITRAAQRARKYALTRFADWTRRIIEACTRLFRHYYHAHGKS